MDREYCRQAADSQQDFSFRIQYFSASYEVFGAMGNCHLKRDSWESLSSAFSNLEVSVSRDSFYGSDDFSMISNLPATAVTSPSTSVASIIEPVSRQSLKSILKQSHIRLNRGTEWESDYGSDDGEYASVEGHYDEG